MTNMYAKLTLTGALIGLKKRNFDGKDSMTLQFIASRENNGETEIQQFDVFVSDSDNTQYSAGKSYAVEVSCYVNKKNSIVWQSVKGRELGSNKEQKAVA